MKFIFLTGGFAGFALTAATGFLVGREPDLVLRDSAIASIVCAFLFKWFWRVFVKALTEAVTAKRAADAATEAAAQAQAKTK